MNPMTEGKATTQEIGVVFEEGRVGNLRGILLSGFIPFEGEDGFSEEQEGNEYAIPLSARGVDGTLALSDAGKAKLASKKGNLEYPADFAENYMDLPLLKDGKSNLYVRHDGKLTTEPYVNNDRRNIKSFIVLLPKQATPKRTYGVRATPDVVWPDGKLRKIMLDIKANNPMTREEFAAQKAQATQKRQATSVAQVVANDAGKLVAPLIAKWRAANKDNATIKTLLEGMGEDFINAAPEDIKSA